MADSRPATFGQFALALCLATLVVLLLLSTLVLAVTP